MKREHLVLKAVLTARKYNKQLNKETLLYKYSLISDTLLKAYIDELNLNHAKEQEFIPDEPADEYEREPEYYEYEHYNDYLWNM